MQQVVLFIIQEPLGPTKMLMPFSSLFDNLLQDTYTETNTLVWRALKVKNSLGVPNLSRVSGNLIKTKD